MKRILYAVLTALVVLTFSKMDTKAAKVLATKTEDNITWTVYDNGLLKIDGTGHAGDSDAKKVEYGYFAYKSKITKAVVSEGITEMYASFYKFTKLKEVKLPKSLERLGASTFEGCSSLRTLTIPDYVTKIGMECFAESGLESITIPGSVTIIGESAFYSCKLLESVSIPDTVCFFSSDKDEHGVFYGCESLKKVEIPAALLEKIKVGRHFYGTPWLLNKKGSIKGETGDFKYVLDSKGNLTLSGSGKLGVFKKSKNLTAYKKQIKTIIISKGCKKLKNFQPFCSASGAQKVINNSSAYAFLYDYTDESGAWCNKKNKSKPIDDIKNGTAVYVTNFKYAKTGDETATFKGITAIYRLSSLEIPSDVTIDGKTYEVTSISDKAFKNNTNLYSVDIPDSVTYIGAEAFYGCKYLRYIVIDCTSKLKIGKNAFKKLPASTVIEITGVKGNQKKAIMNKIKKQTKAKVV